MKKYNQYYTSSLFNILNNIDYKLKTICINIFTNEDIEIFNKIKDKIVIYNSELHFFNYLDIVKKVIQSGITIYSDNIKIRRYLYENGAKPKFINKQYIQLYKNIDINLFNLFKISSDEKYPLVIRHSENEVIIKRLKNKFPTIVVDKINYYDIEEAIYSNRLLYVENVEAFIKNITSNIYISNELDQFKDQIKIKYNKTDYINSGSCIFFGMYSNNDINTLKKHDGYKFLIWGGNDCNWNYRHRVKNLDVINKIPDLYHIAISKTIQERLIIKNIESIYIDIFNNDVENKAIVENKPVENKAAVVDKAIVENKPIKNKVIQNKPIENKPIKNKVIQNKPIENKPIENKVIQNKPIENKPIENKPIENKPVENKAAIVNKPVENKPVENKAAVVNKAIVENKPIENKVIQNKSVENNNKYIYMNLNFTKNKKIYKIEDFESFNLEYNFSYDEMLKINNGDIYNEINLIENLKDLNKTIYVNQLFIFGDSNKKPDISIVRGDIAIKRKNIPRPKFSICVPYDDDCDGIYCITQSWIEEMKNKDSLLCQHVYDINKFDEINNKPIILIEQKIKKEWYNWMSDEEILKLRKKYYPNPDTFIICICGRIAVNSYPKSLIEAIILLRNQGYDIQLLVLGNLIKSQYRLTRELYEEIKSFNWVKSFTVPRKEVLNYYRICDILASTYNDYCNVVGGSNKIKEFLLCDKPILCSRGKERERELGKKYIGLYDCDSCIKIPPLNLINDFLEFGIIKQEYLNILNIRNYNDIKHILIKIENILYKKIHKQNYKNFSIGIYQENLAIRAYKLGLSLYLKGYKIYYINYKYSFDINYDELNCNFFEFMIFNNNTEYNNFLNFVKYKLNDLIFINAWENFAVKSINLNPLYYIGDMQILRYKSLKNGLQNISICNEKSIVEKSNRLIFSNKYMVDELKLEKYNIDIKNYNILQNSLIYNKNYLPHVKDYTNKNNFNLVYIGSLTLPDSNHHRNILDIFKQIVNYNNSLFIDLYITKINLEIVSNLNLHENIKIKESINQNFITSELSKYDFGLVIFNKDYNDNEYLDISQPNKFFDYYFSNLPTISISSKSFNDFILNNNLGIIINNYNIDNNILKKNFFEPNNYKSILPYQEQLQNCYTPHNLFPIKYLYTSSALNFFKNIFENKFKLLTYDPEYHKNENVAFFGIYYQVDLEMIKNHLGKKIYIPGGSDINFNDIVNKNYLFLENQKVEIYCQSKYIYDNCSKYYDNNLLYLNPITPVIIEDFYSPKNIKGNYIYIYTCEDEKKANLIYGKEIYTEVINKLSNKYNFIICVAKTTNNIKEIYEKCFIGLRLTKLDGLGCTNIELGLMGIKCITNNISPNCLSWNNIDDIIKHIENESKNIGKSDHILSNKVYDFIKQENKIFNNYYTDQKEK